MIQFIESAGTSREKLIYDGKNQKSGYLCKEGWGGE